MKSFLAILMLALCLSAAAQEIQGEVIPGDKNVSAASGVTQEAPFYGLRVFTENDFFSPLAPNLDDNYTGGLKVDFITNQFQFLRFGKLFKKEKWDIVAQNISYGFTIFTPRDLANDKIIRTDRPYACYEFISAGSSFVKNGTYKSIMGYELFAGRMGSQAGKNFQTTIHKNGWFGSTRPVPQGWQHQIANGGAVALNIKLFSESNIFETQQLNHFKWLQTSWIHEVNLGQYLINYSQALRLNLLNINSYFGRSFSAIQNSGLPTIATKRPPVSADKSQTATKKNNFSFNLYIKPGVRVVGHNATLTGNLLTKTSEYSLAQKDVIPALVEYDMGLNVRWCFVNLGANLSGRSREFTFQDKAFHHWGGIYVAFVYNRNK